MVKNLSLPDGTCQKRSIREERLAKALRSNLGKRKSQGRVRRQSDDGMTNMNEAEPPQNPASVEVN
jgi:hypothetical protein